MKRRDLLVSAASVAAFAGQRAVAQQTASSPTGLPLEQYQPKSALHARETHIERARYPVIDFHTHISWSGELTGVDAVTFNAKPSELLPVMDRCNIRIMVNCTGGYRSGLSQCLRELPQSHPGRFLVFTEPWWSKAADRGYSNFQADEIAAAHRAGAKGIKVMKILGLYLREHGTTGTLVRIDDRRFDAMWETAGALGMPVGIHSSDPEAFFLPIDRFNERWEELHNHPDWSFHGRDFPSNRELQEARRNVMRRHPNTQFVCFHVADAEDLDYVSECMDSHPNMSVEIAARIGELGRQPRRARAFIEKYQDRVMFGTDAVPKGYEFPQQVFDPALYEIYYRFLETDDEYFDYAPANVPPQGRWRIYGLGLEDSVLKKVYWSNAARLLGLSE